MCDTPHFLDTDIVERFHTLHEWSDRAQSELFDEDVYHAIDLDTCVNRRISEGGTSVESVRAQIAFVKEKLGL